MLKYNFITQEVCPNSIPDLKVDASFRKIAKNAICFHIWKIEEDRLEAEPKAQYGTFVDDCAYIIYAAGPKATYVNQDTIMRDTKPATYLERFIHFWLGEKVSEQKRSNVAHKIQELDSYFNNVATEYRETQGNESARFLSYFKRGFNILSSNLIGSPSANRLYRLYGRKWLRCVEMDTIAWDHFGSDYVMVLKTEVSIFIWIGRSSSSAERRGALEWAAKFDAKPCDITVVDDGYEQSMPDKLKNQWNSFLPLNQRVVSQTSAICEKQHNNKLKIYKCGYRGTKLHLDQLDVVIPTQNDLNDTATAYVLDGCLYGVWLWVGNMAPHQDKISAMGNGRAFVKKKKYAYSTPVIRVVQGHEPVEFIRLFPTWQLDATESTTPVKPVATIFKLFDALTLSQRPKMAADTQLIDDGSGERQIYRVTMDQVIKIPESKLVIFITNHCYVVEYTVVIPTTSLADAQNVGVSTIIYQWNGAEANSDDIANCERFALSTFQNLRQRAMFVQMSEYDETPHFLQIFDGKLILLQCDKDMHQHSIKNNLEYSSGEMLLMNRQNFVLRIYGDTSFNCKAVEVYPLTSMNAKECYVVKTDHVWVWCGRSSTGDAREMAKNVGNLLGECSLVVEGKEPKDFWRSVTMYMSQPLINGGSTSNSSNGSVVSQQNGTYVCNNNHGANLRLEPQLFLVWLQRGKFYTQEIIGYEQTDLSPESVYVLDTGSLAYIWLGNHASNYEKDKYIKMAQNYLETVPIARRPTTAVAVIRQDAEPNTFKGLFQNWDHNLWNNYICYEQKRQTLMKTINASGVNGGSIANGHNSNGVIPSVMQNHQKDFDRHHKYPIATLQQEIDLLPTEVNPLKREVHLTHDDFVSAFNMSFWEFDELPVWKKQELKKKHKLF